MTLYDPSGVEWVKQATLNYGDGTAATIYYWTGMGWAGWTGWEAWWAPPQSGAPPGPVKVLPELGPPERLPAEPLRLVLITGLSGSGKSVVAKCFEDLGYYTVDNLPLPLLREFLERPGELVFGHERIAVVADVRAPGFAEEFPQLIAEIDRAGSCPARLSIGAHS